MGRRVFDVMASVIGVALVVVLLVAGGLLMWGYNFTRSNVHNQLAQQQIFFPPKAEITPGMIPYLEKYAGQQLVTGQQAQAYADHFIAVHLSELPYGGVYSKLSSASRANPKDAKLAALVETSFKGTTLRGLLLEAYAFSKIGQVMLWGSIASFSLALIMLILVVLGLRHARRTPPDEDFLTQQPRPS